MATRLNAKTVRKEDLINTPVKFIPLRVCRARRAIIKPLLVVQNALNVRQVKRVFHYCHCAGSPWVRRLVYHQCLGVCVPCVLLMIITVY